MMFVEVGGLTVDMAGDISKIGRGIQNEWGFRLLRKADHLQ